MTTTIDVLAVPPPPSAPRPVAKGRAQAPGHQPGHAHGRAAEVAHPFAEALAAEQQPATGDDTSDDPTDGAGSDQQPLAAPSPAAPATGAPVAVPEVPLVLASLPPVVADPADPSGPVADAGPDVPDVDPFTAAMPIETPTGTGAAPVSRPATGPVLGVSEAALGGPDAAAVDPSAHPGAPEEVSRDAGPSPTAAPESAGSPMATRAAPEPSPDQPVGTTVAPEVGAGVDAPPDGTVTGEPGADHDPRPAEPDRPARPQMSSRPAQDADPTHPSAPVVRPVEPASPAPAAAGPAAPAPAPSPGSSVATPPAAGPPAAPVAGPPGAEISTVARSEPGAAADQATSSAQPWQQVVEVLRTLKRFSDGSHRLSIRLRPEELGTVHVELSLHRGSLSLHLVAEHAAARDLLARSLGSLRADLEAAGVRTGWLDVGSRTAQDQGMPGGSPRGTARWAPAGRSDRPAGVPATVPRLTVPSARPVAADGRLDLRL